MEDAEMVALKKAYADVILNTVKEAAARVMTAERRARRFEEELRSAKEEGLRLLLRLKQMLDSKISETEMTTISQRRRIEELEAQLLEAEEIVVDLRIQLDSVHSELKMVNDNQIESSHVQVANEEPCHENEIPACEVPTFESATFTQSGSEDANLITSDQRTTIDEIDLDNQSPNALKHTVISIDSHVEHDLAEHNDLDSSVMMTKTPEMYKKGCTQRIWAFEGNILDGKFPPEDLDDHCKSVIKDKIKDEKGADLMISCSPNTKNDDIVKDQVELQGVRPLDSDICGEVRPVKLIRMLRRRRRTPRFRSTKSRLCKSSRTQFTKPSHLSGAFCKSKTYSSLTNGDTPSAGPPTILSNVGTIRTSSELEGKLQRNGSCFEDKAVKLLNKEHKNRIAKTNDKFAASSRSPGQLTKSSLQSPLSHCKSKFSSANIIAKSCRNSLETTESSAKLHSPTNLGSCSAVTAPTLQDVPEDKDLIDVAIVVKDASEILKDSAAHKCMMGRKIVPVPTTNAEVRGSKASEANKRDPCHAENQSPFKYTFQRKRKKELLSNSDENSSLGKSNVKRRLGDADDGAPEQSKSSMLGKSVRSSRRLAQVARQLITLSGKRW